ncbi:MAG TPA: MFS transporter [Nitrososphaerales archaeon]|nr:MFS transporter [Nitrososphaerales archaeon]
MSFDVLDKARLRPYHWYLVITAAIGGFSDFYNVAGVTTGSSFGILAYFNVTAAAYSAVVLYMNFGILLGALIFGVLVDRYGRKLLFTIDLMMMGVFVALNIFATTFPVYVALRLLVGFSVGGDYPAVIPLVTEFSPKLKRGMMIMIFWLVTAAGQLMGYIMGWALTSSLAGATEWRVMTATGLIPIAVGIVLRIKAPESPRWLLKKGRIADLQKVIRSVTGSTLDSSALTQEAVGQGPPTAKGRSALSLFLSKRSLGIATLCFASLMLVAVSAGLGTYYYPFILASYNISAANSLLYTGLLFAPGMLVMLSGAFFIDKLGRMNTVFFSILAGGFSSFLIYEFHSSIVPLIAIVVLVGSWGGLAEVPLISIGAEIFPTALRGFVSGLQTTAWRVGFIVIALVEFALISSFGVGGLFFFVGALQFLAAAIVLGIRHFTKIENVSLEEASQSSVG